MTHTPSLEEWLQALTARGLEMKRAGNEYKGPCPLCGGTDRFHIGNTRSGHSGIRTHCRVCAQTQDQRAWFQQLVHELFPQPAGMPKPRKTTPRAATDANDGTNPKSPKPPAGTADDRNNGANSEALRLAVHLSEQAQPVGDDTPASHYLTGRYVLPPPALRRQLVPAGLLADCAWLSAERAPRLNFKDWPGWPGLPDNAAGAFLCRFRTADGALSAVSLEALDAKGRRLQQRWRRTFGQKQGAAFHVRTQDTDDTPLIALCEGEIDAIALVWDGRLTDVYALGGTAGFATDLTARHLWEEGRVVIVGDADEKGRKAALTLRLLAPLDANVSVYEPPEPQGDPQLWLSARLIAARSGLRSVQPRGDGETDAAYDARLLAAAWRQYCEADRLQAPLLNPAKYAQGGTAPALDRLMRDLLRLLRSADSAADTTGSQAVLDALQEHAHLLRPNADLNKAETRTLLVMERLRTTDDSAPELARRVEQAFEAARENLPRPLLGSGWEEEPPPRQWLLQDWLPKGEVVLLTGPGENGKSLLTLQLAMALACDRQVLETPTAWLPLTPGERMPNDTDIYNLPNVPMLPPEPVNVCVCGWEDDRGEFQRRRQRMLDALPWSGHPSINNRLEVRPFRGHGALWRSTDGTGRGPTPAGREILKAGERSEAALLVLDPASLALALEENDRGQVSQALDWLAGWAYETQCAVLLTGHPAKAVAGPGRDYSGSTAWRGLVRSLWTLRIPRVFEQPGSEPRTRDLVKDWKADLRRRRERAAELTVNKANYAYADPEPLRLETTSQGACWTRRYKTPAMED